MRVVHVLCALLTCRNDLVIYADVKGMRMETERSTFSYAGLALAIFLLAQPTPSATAQGKQEPVPPADGVPFLIRFTGSVRGLEAGAAVEIRGIRIGDVVSVDLEYDPADNRFVAPVTIAVQPNRLPTSGSHPHGAEETYAA